MSDEELPTGWEKHLSSYTGWYYYLNIHTKESQWDRPEKAAEPPSTEEVQCSHLLVKHSSSRHPSSWREQNINDESKAEALASIKSYREKIVSGELNFQELVAKYSDCSDCSSAKCNSDLGPFGHGPMQKPFKEKDPCLQVGDFFKKKFINCDDEIKIQYLYRIEELILNKEPRLLEKHLNEISLFSCDDNVKIRKIVARFLGKAGVEIPKMLLKIIPVINTLLKDKESIVVKQALISSIKLITNTIKWISSASQYTTDMMDAWGLISVMKIGIINMISENHCDGVTIRAIKFLESVILIQSFKCPEDKDIDGFCLNDLSSTFDKVQLKDESIELSKLLISMIMVPNNSDRILLMCMKSLTFISKRRYTFLDETLKTFKTILEKYAKIMTEDEAAKLKDNVTQRLISISEEHVCITYLELVTHFLFQLGYNPSMRDGKLNKEVEEPIEEDCEESKRAKYNLLIELDGMLNMQEEVNNENVSDKLKNILTNLVNRSDNYVREHILNRITGNIQIFFDIAKFWLEIEYQVDGPSKNYNRLLCTFAWTINNIVDSDTLLLNLYIETPFITKDALRILTIISSEESKGLIVLNLLKHSIIQRHNKQLVFLKVLLCHTGHEDSTIRESAIEIVGELYNRVDLKKSIKAYADLYFGFVRLPNPPEIMFGLDRGRANIEVRWGESAIRACIELYLALLAKSHEMLEKLVCTYGMMNQEMKKITLQLIEAPALAIGIQNPCLLKLVENSPKGADKLITRIIHVIIYKAPPSIDILNLRQSEELPSAQRSQDRETSLRVSRLTWEQLAPCAKWLNSFALTVSEERAQQMLRSAAPTIDTNAGSGLRIAVPNIVADESHRIQTHVIDLEMLELAQQRHSHEALLIDDCIDLDRILEQPKELADAAEVAAPTRALHIDDDDV